MSKPSIAVDLNKFLKLLPQYESNKRVGALQISGIFPNPRGVELHFVNDSVIPFQMTSGWIEDQNPHVGGYLVTDDDGHLSFLPADVFYAGYSSATDFRSADFDEDLLERRFWQFDAARKESGDERFTFKGFMRAFAVRCARGVTKHTVGDVEKANFFARSDSPPPVVMDGIIPSVTQSIDIWDTLKDLGQPITCQIKFREDRPDDSWIDGKTVRLLCDGRKFSNETYFGGEYILTPVDQAESVAFITAGLMDFNRKPCIASGDVVVLVEGFAELAAPVSIRQLEPAVLPAQIICYDAKDLYGRSSVLTALGNVSLGDQQNLAILYSECLGIAAAENMDFLQLIYFLDVGVRALFRVRGIQDCWASSLNA